MKRLWALNVEAYRQYRDLIRKTVTEINDRFAVPPGGKNKGWKPIEYIEGRVTPPTLVAYHRMADLTLISSVYDGMNLVAKEYVASQVDEVSHLAGAAEELSGSLIVNPYDQEGMADLIRQT